MTMQLLQSHSIYCRLAVTKYIYLDSAWREFKDGHSEGAALYWPHILYWTSQVPSHFNINIQQRMWGNLALAYAWGH